MRGEEPPSMASCHRHHQEQRRDDDSGGVALASGLRGACTPFHGWHGIEWPFAGAAAGASGELSLEKCLAHFTAPEVLSEQDTWYCSKCKEHVRARKTMALWSVPRLLVVHLKRFSEEETYGGRCVRGHACVRACVRACKRGWCCQGHA